MQGLDWDEAGEEEKEEAEGGELNEVIMERKVIMPDMVNKRDIYIEREIVGFKILHILRGICVFANPFTYSCIHLSYFSFLTFETCRPQLFFWWLGLVWLSLIWLG